MAVVGAPKDVPGEHERAGLVGVEGQGTSLGCRNDLSAATGTGAHLVIDGLEHVAVDGVQSVRHAFEHPL
jgi:hypothetical protein